LIDSEIIQGSRRADDIQNRIRCTDLMEVNLIDGNVMDRTFCLGDFLKNPQTFGDNRFGKIAPGNQLANIGKGTMRMPVNEITGMMMGIFPQDERYLTGADGSFLHFSEADFLIFRKFDKRKDFFKILQGISGVQHRRQKHVTADSGITIAIKNFHNESLIKDICCCRFLLFRIMLT